MSHLGNDRGHFNYTVTQLKLLPPIQTEQEYGNFLMVINIISNQYIMTHLILSHLSQAQSLDIAYKPKTFYLVCMATVTSRLFQHETECLSMSLLSNSAHVALIVVLFM